MPFLFKIRKATLFLKSFLKACSLCLIACFLGFEPHSFIHGSVLLNTLFTYLSKLFAVINFSSFSYALIFSLIYSLYKNLQIPIDCSIFTICSFVGLISVLYAVNIHIFLPLYVYNMVFVNIFINHFISPFMLLTIYIYKKYFKKY